MSSQNVYFLVKFDYLVSHFWARSWYETDEYFHADSSAVLLPSTHVCCGTSLFMVY